MIRSAAAVLLMGTFLNSSFLPSAHGSALTRSFDRTKDLVQELLDVGEKVTREQFQELASIGTLKAAKGLHKVIDDVRSPYRVRIGYQAFVAFAKDAEVLEFVLKALRKDALGHKKESHRFGAALGLTRLGASAHEALIEITEKAEDEKTRRMAVASVIDPLARRADAKALDLLFNNTPLEGNTRSRLLKALAQAVKNPETGEAVVENLADRLADRRASTAIKALLLEILADQPTEESTKAILGCLRHESPEVQLAAISIVGAMGDPEHADELESLTRTKDDDAVVRGAIASLGQILRDDEKQLRQARRWAKDKRPGARMGAALALAYGTDQRSGESLRELLLDEDWRVRAEALIQVGSQRRATDIPVLIERLGAENGRLGSDVALVLRQMTGMDHGQTAKRWRAWWEDKGASFEMPTLEKALAAMAEREKRGRSDRSAASFYGLSVRSNSVAFVIDVSGSMSAKAKGRASTRQGGKTQTRLEVAKDQLATTVEGLGEGVNFNIIVYGTRVRTWSSELKSMGKKTRQGALDFVQEIALAGGTNTFGGLMAAFGDAEVDTIYLLSDGQPSAGELRNPDEIRERIKLLNATRKVRIHCISIGQASGFMRELAKDTGGRYVEAL